MTSADDWDDLFLDWGKDANGDELPLTVEPYLGPAMAGTGKRYGAEESHPGLPQMSQERLVRNSDNNVVTSSSAVYAPMSLRGSFPLHSRVRLATGRVATVVGLADNDNEELFTFLRVDLA